VLLDIHGQATAGGVIYRGTGNGRTVASLMLRHGAAALNGPKSILGRLQRMGYHVMPAAYGAEGESRYAGGYIVRTYGSHRPDGVDAIQLEIGSKLRARPNLDRTATDLADAIAVFAREFLPISLRSSALTRATSP
jgi:N-formylglutamate amidohydrolase